MPLSLLGSDVFPYHFLELCCCDCTVLCCHCYSNLIGIPTWMGSFLLVGWIPPPAHQFCRLRAGHSPLASSLGLVSFGWVWILAGFPPCLPGLGYGVVPGFCVSACLPHTALLPAACTTAACLPCLPACLDACCLHLHACLHTLPATCTCLPAHLHTCLPLPLPHWVWILNAFPCTTTPSLGGCRVGWAHHHHHLGDTFWVLLASHSSSS